MLIWLVWGRVPLRDVRGGAIACGAGRGGAKKHLNQLTQKFDKSVQIVFVVRFIMPYGVLIKENIACNNFKGSFCKQDTQVVHRAKW